MRSRWSPAAVLMLWLLCAGCGAEAPPGSNAAAPPDPDLAHMEDRVRALLEERRAAVLADPASADRWGRLGAAYQAHRLLAEADACYTRATALAPDTFRWAYLQAIVTEVLGRDADAVEAAFDRAAALRPDYAALYVRLGDALSMRGRYPRAVGAFERAIALAPDEAPGYRGLGLVLLALERLDEAHAHLARAVELAPQDRAALAALARVEQRLGRTAQARAVERRAREAREGAAALSDPVFTEEVAEVGVSAMRSFGRAATHLARGEYAEAIADLEIVLETHPDEAAAYYWLGIAHQRAGHGARAIAHLARALELQPEMAPARRKLEEAARALEARIAHNPADTDAQRYLAQTLDALGRAEEAQRHSRDAERLDAGPAH